MLIRGPVRGLEAGNTVRGGVFPIMVRGGVFPPSFSYVVVLRLFVYYYPPRPCRTRGSEEDGSDPHVDQQERERWGSVVLLIIAVGGGGTVAAQLVLAVVGSP